MSPSTDHECDPIKAFAFQYNNSTYRNDCQIIFHIIVFINIICKCNFIIHLYLSDDKVVGGPRPPRTRKPNEHNN